MPKSANSRSNSNGEDVAACSNRRRRQVPTRTVPRRWDSTIPGRSLREGTRLLRAVWTAFRERVAPHSGWVVTGRRDHPPWRYKLKTWASPAIP